MASSKSNTVKTPQCKLEDINSFLDRESAGCVWRIMILGMFPNYLLFRTFWPNDYFLRRATVLT